MSYHTPQPWPVAGRVALALVLGTGIAACTEEEQRSTDAVLAVFGVSGVEPPSYAVAVVPAVVEPEPVAPVVVEPPPVYVPPKPQCHEVFRVSKCDGNGNSVAFYDDEGNEVWL